MHQFLLFDFQVSREEIVLVRGKSLNDVASLSTDIQVMDEFIGDISWSSIHFEHVGTILVGRVDILWAHCYLKSEILHSCFKYRIGVDLEGGVMNIRCRRWRSNTIVRCWNERGSIFLFFIFNWRIFWCFFVDEIHCILLYISTVNCILGIETPPSC